MISPCSPRFGYLQNEKGGIIGKKQTRGPNRERAKENLEESQNG